MIKIGDDVNVKKFDGSFCIHKIGDSVTITPALIPKQISSKLSRINYPKGWVVSGIIECKSHKWYGGEFELGKSCIDTEDINPIYKFARLLLTPNFLLLTKKIGKDYYNLLIHKCNICKINKYCECCGQEINK